jgi:hypothetical protein
MENVLGVKNLTHVLLLPHRLILTSIITKKQYEYNYFINNQSKYNCGYNSVNCNNPNCLNTPSPSASYSKYTLLQTPVYIKTK